MGSWAKADSYTTIFLDSDQLGTSASFNPSPPIYEALPVQILRGARVIPTAGTALPDSFRLRNQTHTALDCRLPVLEKEEPSTPHCHPTCRRRMSCPDLGRKFEISEAHQNSHRDLSHEELQVYTAFPIKVLPKAYEPSLLSEIDHDGLLPNCYPQWPDLTRFPMKPTPPKSDRQQTPVVVDLATLAAANPSGLTRNLDLSPGSDLHLEDCRASSRITAHGSGESELTSRMTKLQATTDTLNSKQSPSSAPVNPYNVIEEEVLEDLLSAPMLQQFAATTPKTSNAMASADAAVRQPLRHLAGQFSGSRIMANNSNKVGNMAKYSHPADGFPERNGHLSIPGPTTPQPASVEIMPPCSPNHVLEQMETTVPRLQSPEIAISESDQPMLSPEAKSEVSLDRLKSRTPPDMIRPRYKQRDEGGERMSSDTPSDDSSLPTFDDVPETQSPSSHIGSDMESDEDRIGGYETPLTSPCSSPPKVRLGFRLLEAAQVDGESGDTEVEVGITEAARPIERALESRSTTGYSSTELPQSSLGADEVRASRTQPNRIDLAAPPLDAPDGEPATQQQAVVLDTDDITPLVPASPAKSAAADAFPFSSQSTASVYVSNKSQSRHPSALLRHCERNATPRQRRLMTSGIRSPDRFIPARAVMPGKLDFMIGDLSKTTKPASVPDDPFGPSPRRSIRMAERYATLRHAGPGTRTVGLHSSRVRDALPTERAMSEGTIWTVSSTAVIEGVASVTNGRGGRVTSGSSAPHYSANFLRRNTPSDEEVLHSRRLAVAMDLESLGEAISPSGAGNGSSPSLPGRVWRDGIWEVEGDVTPTKATKPNNGKGVPIIPFRVLDAPALRDDYYCSLLAYSPTIECLAVGLGAHVYLWCESRSNTRTIPDSLTAPIGSAHVTSVSFSSVEGNNGILAIGRADGRITLWSPLDHDPRFDSEQPAPVSCVCFRPTTAKRTSHRDAMLNVPTEDLLVSDELGYVYYYSVEWPKQDERDLFDWHGSMTLLARIGCHSQQVCGIAWSPDGDFFATGGNDNSLILFERTNVLQPSSNQQRRSSNNRVRVRNGSSSESSNATVVGQGEVLTIEAGQERHVFTLNAAVKAIAFAPWQPTLIAAGGGSNDRCIHFFHTLSGASLATIDCHAQVTSLVWSEKRKEIVATFGFAQPEHPYRIAVFTWPSCAMVVGIPWAGEERALYSVAYPKGPSSGPARNIHTRAKSGRGSTRSGSRADTEGRPWYGKRTREEGCLVVATSDASIKFHEIWAEKTEAYKKKTGIGVLGGSQILEGECSEEVLNWGTIR